MAKQRPQGWVVYPTEMKVVKVYYTNTMYWEVDEPSEYRSGRPMIYASREEAVEELKNLARKIAKFEYECRLLQIDALR